MLKGARERRANGLYFNGGDEANSYHASVPVPGAANQIEQPAGRLM
jgi:hypothetical protein